MRCIGEHKAHMHQRDKSVVPVSTQRFGKRTLLLAASRCPEPLLSEWNVFEAAGPRLYLPRVRRRARLQLARNSTVKLLHR